MNVSDVLMLTLLYLSQSHVTEAIRSSVIGMLRPQPTSGAIQVDAYGRPVHLAEPGRVWNVSPSSQGGSVAASYGSSADTSASYEPNLHYGTLQLKGGPLLDKSPAVPPAAEIQEVDSSLGSKAAGARLGNVLGSLRRSGIDSLQLPGFSLPTLNLRLPWSLKKALAAESNAILPSTDAVCDRDYSLRCPVGWKPRGEEECEAPGEYTGGCPHLLRVNNIDSQQRRKMETECKVHWPCLGDRCAKLGGRDYSAECPKSFGIHRRTKGRLLFGLATQGASETPEKSGQCGQLTGSFWRHRYVGSNECPATRHFDFLTADEKLGLCHSAQNWDAMSPGQKEMLKRACNVDCPSADTWNAEASPLSEATAARLLEGTAGT
ncbi:hypothetical protein Esti_003306 [Eimeria stiedai]